MSRLNEVPLYRQHGYTDEQVGLPIKPAWADKTCEHCTFRVDARCRRAISSYGYAQVLNHGRFQLACSHLTMPLEKWQETKQEQPCQ